MSMPMGLIPTHAEGRRKEEVKTQLKREQEGSVKGESMRNWDGELPEPKGEHIAVRHGYESISGIKKGEE